MTGRCPWCGEVLAPNYTVLLPIAIRRAEEGGFEPVSALRMLTGSWARLRIKPESVLEPIEERLTSTPREEWGEDVRRGEQAIGAGSTEPHLPEFKRQAALDAEHISVEVNGREVILRGTVRSLAEREEAEKAAWAAPGVTSVKNYITVRAAA